MLAQQVVREFEPKAVFAVEDFGASPLADRFGVSAYPAIFIDETLVAIPQDFYAWGGAGEGKYIPWSDLANRRKFQADLRRMIEVRLAGGEVPSVSPGKAGALARTLPEGTLADLAGGTFTFDDLRGTPVIVEMWAPWCPPCLKTLSFFRELDGVEIVGVAVESTREDVDAALAKFGPPGRFVMATPELVESFGGVPAVPTLFLADREGRIVRVFFGAAPGLHEELEAELAKLR